MNREHADAISSLSRTKDWPTLVGYVEEAIRELEMSLGYIDPTSAIEIAKVQGARNALMNFLDLEETALQSYTEDES